MEPWSTGTASGTGMGMIEEVSLGTRLTQELSACHQLSAEVEKCANHLRDLLIGSRPQPTPANRIGPTETVGLLPTAVADLVTIRTRLEATMAFLVESARQANR